MEDCNPNITPATIDQLGPDKEGMSFDEKWEYLSIIGMLMFLANTTRPDIAYAVYAYARYTHNPKQSHGTAVKHILRYLQGTRDKSMYIKPNVEEALDCHVDSNFAGHYHNYPDQDPTSAKSRTGYIIKSQGCPILWVSKIQIQCALSTTESKYLTLSQVMRDLIPFKKIMKDINQVVIYLVIHMPKCTANSKSFGDILSTEQESPLPKSKVYEDNAACLKLARLRRLTPQTKHIVVVPHCWFRYKVEQLEITIEPNGTDKQLVDQFTKPLSSDKFVAGCKDLMGW